VRLFSRKCQEYAELFYPRRWRILSAKYGFCRPDDIILGPYDVCFYKKDTNPLSAEQLTHQAHQLRLDECNRIVVLAGQQYVGIVQQVFAGHEIVTPLGGTRGIGDMLKTLNTSLSKPRKRRADGIQLR
jgi:hypothetical protein